MLDRLHAVGDPGLRDALLFVRGQPRPVTADELARRASIHRNVARSRLERLAAAGLVEVGFERRGGRGGPGAGRPAKTYAAAAELASIEFPDRRYGALVALLARRVPPARARAAGVEFGKELARAAGILPARGRRTGLEHVCAGVRSLGFQATLERFDGHEAELATPTCPLRPLVVGYPETAAIDAGMWTGLAEAALAGVSAEAIACTTGGCMLSQGPCRVTLALKEEAR